MIDITRDEFWENNYEEVTKKEYKNNRVKDFVRKHKIIIGLLTVLTIIMTVNTILIYNFIKILITIS